MIELEIIPGQKKQTCEDYCYQYDKGQRLHITGLESFAVEFANEGDLQTSEPVEPDGTGIVSIPDSYFNSGKNITVYIILTGTMGDVQTRYEFVLPVIPRPRREERGE